MRKIWAALWYYISKSLKNSEHSLCNPSHMICHTISVTIAKCSQIQFGLRLTTGKNQNIDCLENKYVPDTKSIRQEEVVCNSSRNYFYKKYARASKVCLRGGVNHTQCRTVSHSGLWIVAKVMLYQSQARAWCAIPMLITQEYTLFVKRISASIIDYLFPQIVEKNEIFESKSNLEQFHEKLIYFVNNNSLFKINILKIILNISDTCKCD